MDVAATFTTRRGAAAERFFRAASAEESELATTTGHHQPVTADRGLDSDHEGDDHPSSTTTDHEEGRVDNGDDCFVPSNAVEQVLHDPYLLLKIFRRLFGATSASASASSMTTGPSASVDHLRPHHRRLANVRRVCTLWRAVARIICPPVDYLRARPSRHLLTSGTGIDAGETAADTAFTNSSLLSLVLLPLPAILFPSAAPPPSPSTPPSPSSSSSSTQPPSSSSSASSSSSSGMKLYVVSGYSEGEVKIWDVDGTGPDGSHCVRTLQYTMLRWFNRRFRSMALASLVELRLPTYSPEEERKEREIESRRSRSNSGQRGRQAKPAVDGGSASGLMARLGSASPFSLVRSSTVSTATDQPSPLLLPRSVDDLPTVSRTRKRSWIAKKWERSKAAGNRPSSSSPLSSPPSSPQALPTLETSPSPSPSTSPPQSPTALTMNDRGYTSAPVVSRRNRYSLYRERIMAQESIESSELMKRIEEEEEEEEVAVAATQEKPAAAQRADAESSGDWAVGGGEEVWELASIPWPAAVGKEAREGSASTRGRRGHLASVYYHLILIWDVVQGECLRALEGHTLEVNALQPLKGGRQLASGSEDKSIRIWDVTTGQCLRVLQRMVSLMRSPVLSLATLPNGHLVAGAENNKITVWDVDAGKRVNTIKGATEPVWHFQVMYDKQGLFADVSDSKNVMRLVSSTGHWDPEKRTNKGQVAVWDVKNAKKLRTIFEYDGYARNMMGLPGGYLAVAIHYYGSSNTNARLVILDLNAIAATAPQSSTAPLSSPPSTRRRTTDDCGSSATTTTTTAQSRITRRRERQPSPSSNSSRSRSGSSEGDASGDDADAYEDGEDEEDGDKQRERERQWSVEEEEKRAVVVEEREEGDGSTWRLVPGTKDLKVNSMVVLPDGRLVGAASDGCIWVWSFDTKSRCRRAC